MKTDYIDAVIDAVEASGNKEWTKTAREQLKILKDREEKLTKFNDSATKKINDRKDVITGLMDKVRRLEKKNDLILSDRNSEMKWANEYSTLAELSEKELMIMTKKVKILTDLLQGYSLNLGMLHDDMTEKIHAAYEKEGITI